MCGIIGFSSDDSTDAVKVLLDGLSSLEYRGYDSAGIAFFEGASLKVVKAKGKVSAVRERVGKLIEARSRGGIGHTRWATHGEPSDINSHPHGNARVQIVHNGIIENYRALLSELREQGYSTVSETDSEVVALLIDKYYKQTGDPKKAILRATCRLKGSYALGVVFKDYPCEIFGTRSESPLVVGFAKGKSFICSDVTALLPYTRDYYILPEGAICEMRGGSISFFDSDLHPISLKAERALWDESEARLGGYSHFMLKEIHEQSEAIRRTLCVRITDGKPNFEHDGVDFERLHRARRIYFVGCGTAYHACLIGKRYLERYTNTPIFTEIASEFRYSSLALSSEDVVIAVSQSGETADTLSAIKRANEAGAYTIGIVNVVASSIALESECVIYTMAGPEISVASTKAYVIQCSILCLFSLAFGAHIGKISDTSLEKSTTALINELPRAIDDILEREDEIALLAKRIHTRSSLFFIGRGIDYLCVLEASLKLKEISYIHSEAYPAGELKHGTISLIEKGVPVVALCTEERLKDKLESNIREVASRGALVIRVEAHTQDRPSSSGLCFELPPLDSSLLPIACASVFQLFAYYTALERNCDVDHPRNLAKSVTVE